MSQFYITKAFVCPYNRIEYQTDKKGDKIPNELLIKEWIEFQNLSDRIVDLTSIQLYNQNYREDGTKIGEQRLTEFHGQIFAWDLVRVHSGKGDTYRSGKIHHTFLNRNYFTWNIYTGITGGFPCHSIFIIENNSKRRFINSQTN